MLSMFPITLCAVGDVADPRRVVVPCTTSFEASKVGVAVPMRALVP